jgi:hypothetical protein
MKVMKNYYEKAYMAKVYSRVTVETVTKGRRHLVRGLVLDFHDKQQGKRKYLILTDNMYLVVADHECMPDGRYFYKSKYKVKFSGAESELNTLASLTGFDNVNYEQMQRFLNF